MPEPILITPQTVPVGTCIPGNAQALVNLVAGNVTATFQNSQFALWNFGSNTPDPSLQDRPWQRTTADGKPLGVYVFYNGKWVKQGPPVGTVSLYLGTGPSGPSFDSTGKGIPGTDGEGWFVMNGQNGTPFMDGLFPIGGTYTGGQWQSYLNNTGLPSTTGGSTTTTLLPTNIPPLAAQVPRGSSQPGSAAGFQYGASSSDGNTVSATVTSGAATPFLNAPPYRALGFIIFLPYN